LRTGGNQVHWYGLAKRRFFASLSAITVASASLNSFAWFTVSLLNIGKFIGRSDGTTGD
jgi:hypothetical protein